MTWDTKVVVLWEDKKSCSCQISDFSFKGNYKSSRKGTTSWIKAWEISRLSKNIKMFTVDKEWNNFSDGKSLLSLYHDLCHNWAVPQLQKSTLFTQYSVLLIVKSCSKSVKSMSSRMPDNFCQKTHESYLWISKLRILSNSCNVDWYLNEKGCLQTDGYCKMCQAL